MTDFSQNIPVSTNISWQTFLMTILLDLNELATICLNECYLLHFSGAWEPGSLYFWETFQNFPWTTLLLGSGLIFYQTATSKVIANFITTFSSSWGKKSTILLWHHLHEANLGWEWTKICVIRLKIRLLPSFLGLHNCSLLRIYASNHLSTNLIIFVF